MGKLHELLAVEPGRREAYLAALSRCTSALDNETVFLGGIKRLIPTDGGDPQIVERVQLATTVKAQLAELVDYAAPYLDCLADKDAANQSARADLVIDGHAIGSDLPATFLLGLEARLAELKKLVVKMPVHEAAIEWIPDASHELAGVMRSKEPIRAERTKKVFAPVVMVPATQQHPAQVKEEYEDKVVGRYETERLSGMVSAREKRQMLDRIDTAIETTRKARMRANEAETSNVVVGVALMRYLFGELKG